MLRGLLIVVGIFGLVLLAGACVSWRVFVYLGAYSDAPETDIEALWWLDETRVAVATDRAIEVHDLRSDEVSVVAQHPYPPSEDGLVRGGQSCFSPDRWRWEPAADFDAPRAAFVVRLVEGRIASTERDGGDLRSSQLNPFDCRLRDGWPPPDVPAGMEARRRLFPSDRDGFVGLDDGHVLLGWYERGALRTLALEPLNEDALRSPVHDVPWVVTWRDRGTGALWAEIASTYPSDAGQPSAWPRRLYRLDLASATVGQTLDVPAGPWLLPYDDERVCFSCGCGCYRDAELLTAGGQVFAHVWGRGMPEDVQGLYRLDDGRWTRLVQGHFAPPLALSPSGCRVALAAESLRVEDLCAR